MSDLNTLIGVGPKTITKLNKLNILSIKDLLYHFPINYLDFTNVTTINKAYPEDNVSLNLVVTDFKNIYSKNHKNIQIVTGKDSTGSIKLFWLNQPYLSKTIKVNQKLSVAGQISLYNNQKTIFFPFLSFGTIKKIFPIYPQTKGITSNQISKIILSNQGTLLKNAKDIIPSLFINKYNLLPLKTALIKIHQPQSVSDINTSQHRLSIDELLSIHLNSIILKKHWQSLKTAHPLTVSSTNNQKILSFIKSLPFILTSDQKKVWKQVKTDLISQKVTNRLMQGDVGSGKTIIAILACYLTYLNSKLSVVIVPTQILASQHLTTFKKFLPKIPIHLMTSATKRKQVDPTKGIIIATQAIFFKKAKLINKVSLVIIDEQHKFGVNQRNLLLKIKNPPHNLTMTATPIPRSVKLTLLKNLDVSSIRTKPKNRQDIKTFIVYPEKQQKCYQYLSSQIKANQSQVFVICPFIEDSQTLDVPSALTTYQKLVDLFPNLKIGLLHGLTFNKDQVMHDFSDGKLDILVSTSIIEVGIDIKNADHIVINSADRFGLSQIHQLRGRVGRGDKQAFCYLFTSSQNPKTIKRLEFIKDTSNCFRISRFDLANRGPGTIFSTLQHGFPELKLANLNNLELNKLVRLISQDLTKNHPKIVDKIICREKLKIVN